MATIGKRIREARLNAGLTQPQLAERCGWAGQSRVSNYERDEREPRSSDMRNMAKALDVPEAWLWTGEDCALPDGTIHYGDGTRQPQHTNLRDGICGTPAADDDVYLPCIGPNADYITLRFSRYLLERAGVEAANATFTKIADDSMAPIIPKGTTLAFDRDDLTPREGEIYVLDFNGQLRIGYLRATDNDGLHIRFENSTHYPAEDCPANGGVRTIGRVFWWSVVC